MSLSKEIARLLEGVYEKTSGLLAPHEAATMRGYQQGIAAIERSLTEEDCDVYVNFTADTLAHILTILQRHRAEEGFPDDSVREFFNQMIRLEDLGNVPTIHEAVDNLVNEFISPPVEHVHLLVVGVREVRASEEGAAEFMAPRVLDAALAGVAAEDAAAATLAGAVGLDFSDGAGGGNE
ncbi:MAG: hypothetical protein RLN62_01785 [Rickettsiales bacterium]